MRRAISADCTGEPPGELISSATAFSRGSLKARSMAGREAGQGQAPSAVAQARR